MKRLILTLVAALLSLSVTAQEAKRLISIDPATFRPVHTDALSGVAVDTIALDRSKRPCARIKMHVNRMTREDIEQIQVIPIGGSVQLTKRIVAYEGTGIIFELTAKEPTRFYLHHEKYGDSNDVSLNLKANTEYRINAQLNQLYTITVASNMKDADVFVDDRFCGKTNNESICTIHDITPEEHTLRIEHAGRRVEQKILVHRDNVYFRCNVDTAEARPQFVVIEVEPKYAMVFIDNEPQATQDGYVQALLHNGTYNYRVIAKGYLEKKGTFTVAGSKVQFPVRLTADAAQVTITAGDGVEIWVNNELKGPSPWKGVLLSGSYIFEARKAGHRTTVLPQVITSNPAEQSYTLDAPTPIKGSVMITSVPAMADIYLDSKKIGQTPLMTELLVGNYTLELRRQGYEPKTQMLTIAEGKTSTVDVPLTKVTQQSSGSARSVPMDAMDQTCGPYTVGDLFYENGKKGVVIEVAADGMSGKIVSINSASGLEYAMDANEYKRVLGAVDTNNGANNLAKVKKRPNWHKNYPAFAWCEQLGEGWYLPAIEELKLCITNAVIKTLTENGVDTNRTYLSSTEADGYTHGRERFAMGVEFYYKNHVPTYRVFQPGTGKSRKHSVRAVSKFTADPQLRLMAEARNARLGIRYTTSESDSKRKKLDVPSENISLALYGAKMVSHTVKNGKGIMLFDSEPTKFGGIVRDITSITFPASITEIGPSAFIHCKMESITIPYGVKRIGDKAFESCAALKSVYIPESVTSVGKDLFVGCDALESVTLPSSAKSWDLKALFADCKALREFGGPHSTADGRGFVVDGVLYKVAPAGLTSFSIPEGVTRVEKSAFGWECRNLTELTIPDSVTSIGKLAFAYCNITTVTIPMLVTEIESSAFWGCKSLKSVYCKNPIPPVGGDDMFSYWDRRSDKPLGCTIYVPAVSLKLYKKAKYWKDYKKYIQPME